MEFRMDPVVVQNRLLVQALGPLFGALAVLAGRGIAFGFFNLCILNLL
jgi:hypothetical protein